MAKSETVDQHVRMEVRGLMMDPSSNVPIVILREPNSSRFLPIWIGIFEANAIALQLEEIEPPRPMTHDLIKGILAELHTDVTQVLISDLRDNTFYAQIVLGSAGSDQERTVDARPSDAIAIALRTDAPIFVAEQVLAKANTEERTEQLRDEEKLKKWLEEIDPDDLGKYTM
jgi:bifunctional DNase/RNase